MCAKVIKKNDETKHRMKKNPNQQNVDWDLYNCFTVQKMPYGFIQRREPLPPRREQPLLLQESPQLREPLQLWEPLRQQPQP